MTHVISGKLDVDLTRVDTTAKHSLGETQLGSDGNFYIYIEADEAIAAYAAVVMQEDFGVAELTTTNSGASPQRIVFPQVAIASGSFGWAVSHGGTFSVLAAASCAADVKVYTTATAGVVDDTATDLIEGLRLLTTVGGSQAATTATATGPCSVNTQS